MMIPTIPNMMIPTIPNMMIPTIPKKFEFNTRSFYTSESCMLMLLVLCTTISILPGIMMPSGIDRRSGDAKRYYEWTAATILVSYPVFCYSSQLLCEARSL